MTDHTPNSKVSRLEVVSTGARRRWILEEKQRIVAESYGGPRLVSVTARRNGLSASQLFTWRRLAREDRLSGDAVPALVPVEIAFTAAPGSTRTPQPPSSPPAAMIPIPSGVRVWIVTGHTDMRRGMQSLALTVQESLKRDPHAGDLYIFRGRRGDLVKILWHDGLGMSLYAKRLDRGKFIWPSASDGAVSISAAQMAYMLEGIDWRNPQLTWRPRSAG